MDLTIYEEMNEDRWIQLRKVFDSLEPTGGLNPFTVRDIRGAFELGDRSRILHSDFITIIKRMRENQCVARNSNDRHVDHPSHYNMGEIEVIDAIEDWRLGFHLGNAVKYIARAGKKDHLKTREDLEKAIWYLERYIDKIIANHE